MFKVRISVFRVRVCSAVATIQLTTTNAIHRRCSARGTHAPPGPGCCVALGRLARRVPQGRLRALELPRLGRFGERGRHREVCRKRKMRKRRETIFFRNAHPDHFFTNSPQATPLRRFGLLFVRGASGSLHVTLRRRRSGKRTRKRVQRDFRRSAEKWCSHPKTLFSTLLPQSQVVSKDIIMSRIGLAKYFGALGRLQSLVSLESKSFVKES